MIAVKLQTKYATKRLTSIKVNGHVYAIDSDCVCVVDDPADVKKMLSLGDEWTTSVTTPKRTTLHRGPQPGQPMRNAMDLLELASQDPEIASKLDSFRSFRALSAFAEGLGFRFTEIEFNAAGETFASSRRVEAATQKEHEGKLQKSDAPAKESKSAAKETKGKKGKKDKAAEQEGVLPEVLPEEESGVWPDPLVEMPMPYLQRMAAAYGVQYDGGTTKAALVEAIKTAMYADD
jgi:hypothetical protein